MALIKYAYLRPRDEKSKMVNIYCDELENEWCYQQYRPLLATCELKDDDVLHEVKNPQYKPIKEWKLHSLNALHFTLTNEHHQPLQSILIDIEILQLHWQ